MSEVLDPPVLPPVTAALSALRAALDDLVECAQPGVGGQLWMMTGADLLDAAAGLHKQTCRGEAVLHGLVREVDARGAATDQGAPSTRAWLRERLHLHPGAAKRVLTTARALHDDPSGALVHHADPDDMPAPGGRALLRAAFAAGEISAEHATIATQTLAALRTAVEPDVVTEAEAFLCQQATVRDPLVLARLGRHLTHVLDPDAGQSLADEENADRAAQQLLVHLRRGGSSDVRGRLGPELTAAFLAQLNPLAAPRPSTDGRPDPRTVGQRNAYALAELLRRAAIAGTGPTRHGTRASITITMSLDTLPRRLGSPAATLDWSGPISAEAARRLACDAGIIPVVLGSNGEPLDVGRATYPVTRAIWRALVVRDGGCSFDTCGRPPEWTEAHHLWHWADGGPTSTDNTALFCDHHHHVVHHDGWEAQLIDGAIHVIPPPWIDPDRTPRPNQHPHRTNALDGLPRPWRHDRM
jgi:hypothetical protein